MKVLFLFIAIAAILSFVVYYPGCDGEKKWSKYHGELEYIIIDCEQCCHASSGFKMKGQRGVYICTCDESLMDIPVNETYTIYLHPVQDSYAVTRSWCEPSCFWTQSIDYIEDEQGNVVWGWKWW